MEKMVGFFQYLSVLQIQKAYLLIDSFILFNDYVNTTIECTDIYIFINLSKHINVIL